MTTMTTATIGRRWSTGLGGVVISLLVPVGVVIVWWFLSMNSASPFFPPLSSILETFTSTWMSTKIFTDVLPSLGRMFTGFVIAVIVGIALGVLLGRVRILAYALNPVLQFFRALPATALIPVSIVLLGIGDAPKILLIAFVSVFPILLNTIDGVRNIDPVMEDVCRSYKFQNSQRVRWVQLHAASPQVLAGMRIGLSMAFVVMVVTEMLAATNGIGYVTLTAQQSFQIPLMWSGLLLLGLLGIIINGLFVLVERRLLRWYVQDQED
jgi:ABC-type nitrate/sulfonate/bicarbonate transport system permease component